MALSLVQWDTDKECLVRGGAAPNFRSGRASVGASVTSVVVTFSTALPNTDYVPVVTWQNTTNSFPQQQPIIVTAFSTTGFTAAWSAPTDTAAYSINWIVMQIG